MATTAEQIAAQFGDDGRRFHDDTGRSLADVCDKACISHDYSQKHDAERYTFADGSVITAQGGGWDLGYPNCWCWQGEGHTDDCKAR